MRLHSYLGRYFRQSYHCTDLFFSQDGVQVIPESAPETSLRPAGASQMGGVEAGVDGGLRRASRDLGLHYPRPGESALALVSLPPEVAL